MSDREKALAYFRHREAQTPMPGARAMCQEAIKALEQPEVIRCKDCKHWGKRGLCEMWDHYISSEDFYCGCAGRRTDERERT